MEEACPCITDVQDTAVVGRKKKGNIQMVLSAPAEVTLSNAVFAPRKEELTDYSYMLLLKWVNIFQSFTSMWQNQLLLK